MKNLKFIKAVIISSIILIISFVFAFKMIGIASYFVTSAKTSFVILGILIIVSSIFLFVLVCETQFYSIKWKVRVKKIDKQLEEKNQLEE